MVSELIERANVALDGVTPEPWVHKFRADGSGFISMGGQSVGQKHKQFDTLLHRDDGNDLQDASFIASSRQLVPELIAALSEAIARAERADATSEKLAKSNFELSARLANRDPKYSGHITHVFGMPMDEVLDIINAAKEET